MRRLAIALTLLAVLGTGCSGGLWSSARRPDIGYRALSKLKAPVMPPPGVLYGDVHAPTMLGLEVPPLELGSRKGTATSHQIGLPPLPYPGLATGLDLFAWGEASVDKARKEGGITEVGVVDYRMQTFLFVYRRLTLEVYGH